MKTIDILEALTCFHGTTMYYKHQVFPNFFLTLTDGCNYLRDTCKSYWLFDIIASYQKQLSTEEFQVWKLTRVEENKFKIVSEDGNDNILITQLIPFSDFPLNGITIWLVDGVAMLPSEY